MPGKDSKQKKGGAPTTPEAEGGWENPAGKRGRGGTTAKDAASPLEKEASNEPGTEVSRGFTTTGSSGSAGGRATYGLSEEDEED